MADSGIFVVKVLLNEGRGRFFGYESDDKLVPVDEEFTFFADTPEVALDKVWSVGNKMSEDDEGNLYPPMRRSLSVGDVLVFTGGSNKVWTVEPFGWKELDKSLVLHSLLFGCTYTRD